MKLDEKTRAALVDTMLEARRKRPKGMGMHLDPERSWMSAALDAILPEVRRLVLEEALDSPGLAMSVGRAVLNVPFRPAETFAERAGNVALAAIRALASTPETAPQPREAAACDGAGWLRVYEVVKRPCLGCPACRPRETP